MTLHTSDNFILTDFEILSKISRQRFENFNLIKIKNGIGKRYLRFFWNMDRQKRLRGIRWRHNKKSRKDLLFYDQIQIEFIEPV